jgi:hypothetical protein
MKSYRNDKGSGNLWLEVVNDILKGRPNSSLLDLMCHKAPHTPLLDFQSITFVDIQNRGLDFPLRNTDEFVEQDAIEYLECHYLLRWNRAFKQKRRIVFACFNYTKIKIISNIYPLWRLYG